MTESAYRVALVVDPEYGSKLDGLSGGGPVWIIDTAVNNAASERLWKQKQFSSELTGITVFKQYPGLSAERAALNQLDMIDLHHGVYSADPPYSILHVIGTELTEALKAALTDLGFSTFQLAEEGFLAQQSVISKR